MLRERLFGAAACRLLAIVLTLALSQALAGPAAGELDPASRVARAATGVPRRPPPPVVALYRPISPLQEGADWKGADRLIAQLTDPGLLGHVLYQRYMHPTGYRSRFDELSGWLELYADHPDAERVHSLALRRRPPGAPLP